MSNSTLSDALAAVLDTVGAYAQALDDGRTDDLVALFADDAVVDIMGQGVLHGREAIHAGYLRTVPTGPQRHFLGNVQVTTLADNGASVVCDLAVLKRDESGWGVQLTGRYQDILREIEGSWLFTRKVLTLTL